MMTAPRTPAKLKRTRDHKMYKAIITGATGMLALALMRQLLDRDYEIYAVVHPGSQRIENIPQDSRIKLVECDLADTERLPEMIHENCDEFYHFAWNCTFGDSRNNMEAQTENILRTVQAAEAAAKLGCRVFLGAGSQAEFGRKNAPAGPDTPAFPENGYGMAKLCAGQMTREICRRNGVRHIWFRIFSVYGPYDGANTMVMSGINRLLNGERPAYTKGEQQWDYLYCDDAARAFMLAAEKGKDGAVYCIGSGKTRPLSEYILAIRDAAAPGAEIGLGEVPYAEKQVMYLCADISQLTADTGFTPQISFEEGIKNTVDWVKNKRIWRS